MKKIKIKFNLNNENVEIETEPAITLLEVLRKKLKLTGTKEGCGKGDCGACTVIMNKRAVNSCLVLAGQLEGSKILTIEGLVAKKESLFLNLKEKFMSEGAVQCGFCTPGMIMSAYALLTNKKSPSIEDIKKTISGNLCRCTGYHKIVRAIEKAASKN